MFFFHYKAPLHEHVFKFKKIPIISQSANSSHYHIEIQFNNHKEWNLKDEYWQVSQGHEEFRMFLHGWWEWKNATLALEKPSGGSWNAY